MQHIWLLAICGFQSCISYDVQSILIEDQGWQLTQMACFCREKMCKWSFYNKLALHLATWVITAWCLLFWFGFSYWQWLCEGPWTELNYSTANRRISPMIINLLTRKQRLREEHVDMPFINVTSKLVSLEISNSYCHNTPDIATLASKFPSP